MTVALITDGIWPFSIGGMQKHSYLLCKYLLKEGVTVHLFHTNIEHKQVNLEGVFEPELCERLVSHFIEFPTSFYFPGHYLYNTYLYSKRVFRQLQNIRDTRFNFYYIQGFSGWALLDKQHMLASGAKLVLNFHGLEMFQSYVGLKDRFEYAVFRPLVRNQLNKASIVHSLGGKLTLLINANLHNKWVRVIELGNGIEDEWIRSMITPSTELRTFTFIGRYARLKGLPELFEAAQLLKPGKSFKLNFIGPIPDAVKPIDPDFHYFGPVSDEQVIKDVLDQTDFLLVPSYTEGMPAVINEAMARGAAIIATDVGAVREQVGADNGFLIEKPTVQQILAAMSKALEMTATEVDELKQHSLAKVSAKFRWSSIVKELLKSVQHP
jgi:glycosyltransferase involved in cell wall biosynthesis